MLRRQNGLRLFRDDGHIDIDSNLPPHRYLVSTAGQRYENAIRSPAMNRRNALFAPSRDFGPAKTLPGHAP